MNKKGFSLIELVLVIVVIGVSSATLVAVMSKVVTSMNGPQVIAAATALAEKEAERVLTNSFANITAESNTSYTGNFSKYSHQVLVTNVDSNDKIVEIRISNAALPGSGYISLAFLRTNY